MKSCRGLGYCYREVGGVNKRNRSRGVSSVGVWRESQMMREGRGLVMVYGVNHLMGEGSSSRVMM